MASNPEAGGTVIVTGAAGGIGSLVMDALRDHWDVVGLDLECRDVEGCLEMDITSDASVDSALQRIADEHGTRIASVVHLAAYFDFSGEESPMYDAVNVDGTRRLLQALQSFEVEQFLFSSTMLVHAPTEPGVPLTEDAPLDPRWAYPRSKLETERVIERHHGAIPRLTLRLAGMYTPECGLPSLAHQLKRIYERRAQARLFSGDASHGQAFVHSDDVVDAIVRSVERRRQIADGTRILVGEPRVLSYEALQNRMGCLVHGETFSTRRVPGPLARLGAWLQEKSEPVVPDAIDRGKKPFIRSFMIPLADDHYELDISRARQLLGWEPRHALYDTLPELVERLKQDPAGWYRANGLTPPLWLQGDAADEDGERLRSAHENRRREQHWQFLWAHFLNIGVGAWLLTSPPILGYPGTAMGVSDVICGLLVMLFGFASLSWRHAWARLANGAVGTYLLFAPLLFWTPSAAAYLNGTLTGALVIGLALLVRPAVGVGPSAMRGPDIPPGWDYSPSSWTQRLPIIALAFVGLYISRYLAAFQLGHTELAWDPFFGDGTERVITSKVSEAWPVSDAGVGAVTYMLEILTGLIGGRDRWRTMPWLVILFGLMIVPLGAISIFFIVIQPIVIGTWCTLCLVAAAAMLLQIPYSLDELLATCQFLARRRRQGRPLLSVFLHGDGEREGERSEPVDFEQPAGALVRDMLGGGINLPWNLVASALIGAWLMCTRLALGTAPPMADADHLIGAMVVTISVTALAEMARPLRFLNALAGLCLLGTPFMFAGGSALAEALSLLAGVLLIVLSIPRGRVSHAYGSWNRFIF